MILNYFGTFESPIYITGNALKSYDYLQPCISETLRLYPTLAMNARIAVTDTSLPCGGGIDGLSPVFVASGTKLQVSSYVTHRLKDVWGEDAEEWRPERWEGKTTGWETGHLPFSRGPRSCLRRKLDYYRPWVISRTDVRLLQNNLQPQP